MIFFYITILLIPFGNHPLLSYNVGGITPIKLFGGLSLIAAFLELGRQQRRGTAFDSKISHYFIMLIIIFFSSVVANFSQYNSDATLRFVSIVMFFITTVALVNSRNRFIKVIYLIIICMDIASAYMFREYSLYGGMYANFRPGGILGDPNYTALNLLTVIPIALLLIRTCASRFEHYFVLGSFVFCLAALGLSQSRGGYIALGVELLLIAFVMKFRIKLMIGTAIAMIFVVCLLPGNIFSRFSSEDTGVKVSTEYRYKLIQSGLEMFKDNLFFGVGPGNFKAYSDRYSEEVSKKQIAHNSYLELGAELGLIAILLFTVIARRTVNTLNTVKDANAEDAKLAAIFTGIKIGLIGYLVAAAFLSAEFEKIYWLLVFLVAASEKVDFRDVREDEQAWSCGTGAGSRA